MLLETNFSKQYKNEQETLKINFTSETLKSDEENKSINTLLDKCFKSMNSYKDTIKIITLLRTILRNYKEKDLQINYKDAQNKEITIHYVNGVLANFNLKTLLDTTMEKIVDYKNDKISIQISNIANDKMTQEVYEILESEEEISNLKKIKPLKIYETDKFLLSLYKIFYEENPNFSSEDINVKIYMMYVIIMSAYGLVGLKDKVKIETTKEKTYSNSSHLMSAIERLTPFGEIVFDEEDNYIKEELKEIVIAIREVIKDYTKEGQNQLDTIIKFGNILYANNCKIKAPTKQSTLKNIAEQAGCKEVEVKEIIDRIKKAKIKTRKTQARKKMG